MGGCKPPEERQSTQHATEVTVRCEDRVCSGENPPKVSADESLMKVNGLYFKVPKVYGGAGNVLGFFWPSETPRNSPNAQQVAPEFVPSKAGQTSNFYDVGIEIFLRSTDVPPNPRGYELVELARANNWISSRVVLSPDLEALTMKHVALPTGQFFDHVTYYVATTRKGPDGRPPVATCNHEHPMNGGGAGFMWKPGVWVGLRMNQRHCRDWPQIHRALMNVLQSVEQINAGRPRTTG